MVFIRRKVFTTSPVVVEYELTGYSETLNEVLHSLSTWGAMHKQKIRRSMKKERYASAS
jgi:DNA-binding HxlR family transcriptional regulator